MFPAAGDPDEATQQPTKLMKWLGGPAAPEGV